MFKQMLEMDDLHPVSVDHAVYLQERWNAVRSALDCLPKQERLIVVLYFGRDMSTVKIAQRLRLSNVRISQLLLVALQRLRRQVNPALATLVSARTRARKERKLQAEDCELAYQSVVRTTPGAFLPQGWPLLLTEYYEVLTHAFQDKVLEGSLSW